MTRRGGHQLIVLVGLGIVVVLALYSILYLYPAYSALTTVDKQIAEETGKLETLKQLFPVQARAKVLEKIRFKGRLPFQERVEMPRKRLTSLPEKFAAIAARHDMILVSSDFDINAMEETSRSLSLALELNGKLRDLRRLLIDLISYAAFDSISELAIRPGNGESKSITLTLNIRIERAGA